jgi:hypothetical protein
MRKDIMRKKEFTILCSGFGLGLYIPGLLLGKGLNKYGLSSHVHVFESLILEDKKKSVLKSKQAYHKNFAVALMSTRIQMDMRQCMDIECVENLFRLWEEEDRQNFIVLSGHWLHVLDEYRAKIAPRQINVYILYVDGDLPPSWQSIKSMKPDYNNGIEEVWLYSYEDSSIKYQINITDKSPLAYIQRNERFLIHGGGWGMGTYQGKIPELEQAGIPLDIVAYDISEASGRENENRYFMVDPNWTAWTRNIYGQYEFPPLAEIKENEEPRYVSNNQYHQLFNVTREAMAIIGKPGAGTMMDSLGAATPLVMLEPFGDHERINTEIWEAAGFGIRYERWKESGFSTGILEKLHNNIIEKKNQIPDISLYFTQSLLESGGG